MIYENYPMYDIDVEKGTIFSLRYKRIVGRKCGVINKPYLGVTINNKTKLIHRIIWECVNGEIPEGCPYYSRCEMAFDRCKNERPQLISLGKKKIRCFKYEEGA